MLKFFPIGVSFLHVPSEDDNGKPNIIPVKCYFSPHVTQTLINENDFYGPTKNAVNNYHSIEIVKFNNTN